MYLRTRANLREESKCKTEVKLIMSELKKVNPSLSPRALGMAIRRAFPAVVRRKIGPVYYYFGLKLTSVHFEREVSSSKSQIDVADQIRNEKNLSRDLPGKSTCAASRNKHDTKKNKTRPMGGCEQCRMHEIPSLNINLGELKTRNDVPVLGEGTFGKCIWGMSSLLAMGLQNRQLSRLNGR